MNAGREILCGKTYTHDEIIYANDHFTVCMSISSFLSLLRWKVSNGGKNLASTAFSCISCHGKLATLNEGLPFIRCHMTHTAFAQLSILSLLLLLVLLLLLLLPPGASYVHLSLLGTHPRQSMCSCGRIINASTCNTRPHTSPTHTSMHFSVPCKDWTPKRGKNSTCLELHIP